MNEPKSILDGVTEHDVVTVYNPLSDSFDVKIGRSLVGKPRRDLRQTGNSNADAFIQGLNAGIDNGGHMSMVHTQQILEFKPGQSMRMPGDIAKVAVKQIVNEVMQRQGAKKQMADPHFRMEFERKVVLNHESMLSNLSVESAEERFKRQMDDLNKVEEKSEAKADEQPFPTETVSVTGETAGDGEESSKTARRGPGRPPKKTD